MKGRGGIGCSKSRRPRKSAGAVAPADSAPGEGSRPSARVSRKAHFSVDPFYRKFYVGGIGAHVPWKDVRTFLINALDAQTGDSVLLTPVDKNVSHPDDLNVASHDVSVALAHVAQPLMTAMRLLNGVDFGGHPLDIIPVNKVRRILATDVLYAMGVAEVASYFGVGDSAVRSPPGATRGMWLISVKGFEQSRRVLGLNGTWQRSERAVNSAIRLSVSMYLKGYTVTPPKQSSDGPPGSSNANAKEASTPNSKQGSVPSLTDKLGTKPVKGECKSRAKSSKRKLDHADEYEHGEHESQHLELSKKARLNEERRGGQAMFNSNGGIPAERPEPFTPFGNELSSGEGRHEPDGRRMEDDDRKSKHFPTCLPTGRQRLDSRDAHGSQASEQPQPSARHGSSIPTGTVPGARLANPNELRRVDFEARKAFDQETRPGPKEESTNDDDDVAYVGAVKKEPPPTISLLDDDCDKPDTARVAEGPGSSGSRGDSAPSARPNNVMKALQNGVFSHPKWRVELSSHSGIRIVPGPAANTFCIEGEGGLSYSFFAGLAS